MTLGYSILLIPDDNDTFRVECPDLPGLNTFGDTKEEATMWARHAAEEWIAGSIAHGEDVPAPYAPKGPHLTLPTLTLLKVALYRALRADKITRAELTRRLGWNRESVDRLFRLDHNSRLDQIDAAFAALNRTIEPVVKAA